MAKKKSFRVSRVLADGTRRSPRPAPSNSNAIPVVSRLDRKRFVDEDERSLDSAAPTLDNSGDRFLVHSPCPGIQDLVTFSPSPDSDPNLIPLTKNRLEKCNTVSTNDQHAATVTDGNCEPKQKNMNANGSHPPQRQHTQPQQHRDRRSHVSDTVPSSNGISHGPMQSHIQVAKPYVFHQAIEGCLNDLGVAQAREDNIRLAGVRWIDDTRRALKLYV